MSQLHKLQFLRGHKDFPGVTLAMKTLWNGKFWNTVTEYNRFINKLMIHPLCHNSVFQNIFRSFYYYHRGYGLENSLSILCACSECSESLSSKIAAPKRHTEVIRLVCLKKKYWKCLNKSLFLTAAGVTLMFLLPGSSKL